MSAEGEWKVARTGDGSPTLVHPGHGEACHSADGAWSEAWARHVSACDLPRRLSGGGVLRILDVGTGPGLSLAAAHLAAEERGASLCVTTLEIDPRAPRAARELSHAEPSEAPWTRPWRAVADALAAALAAAPDPEGARVAPLGRGRLRLVLGDARLTLPALAPERRFDVVFLDPFSPRTDGALWEPDFLREVARRMAPGSVLSTYSAATAVRAGLLAAGLAVRLGPRFGGKREGTLAGPDLGGEPLLPRLARRLARRAAELAAPTCVEGPRPLPPVAPAPAPGGQNPARTAERRRPRMT